MSSIISVNDLCLWYGRTRALKNINMEMPEKSITALIGPLHVGVGRAVYDNVDAPLLDRSQNGSRIGDV